MVFLDANVLLELILPGRPQRQAVEDRLGGTKEPLCVSALTVHLILHFGHKLGLPREDLARFLGAYVIQDLTAADCQAALGLAKGADYEDALQLAVALRSGCATIITLDKAFAKRYQEALPFSVIS